MKGDAPDPGDSSGVCVQVCVWHRAKASTASVCRPPPPTPPPARRCLGTGPAGTQATAAPVAARRAGGHARSQRCVLAARGTAPQTPQRLSPAQELASCHPPQAAGIGALHCGRCLLGSAVAPTATRQPWQGGGPPPGRSDLAPAPAAPGRYLPLW